jgi:hypothetical protein
MQMKWNVVPGRRGTPPRGPAPTECMQRCPGQDFAEGVALPLTIGNKRWSPSGDVLPGLLTLSATNGMGGSLTGPWTVGVAVYVGMMVTATGPQALPCHQPQERGDATIEGKYLRATSDLRPHPHLSSPPTYVPFLGNLTGGVLPSAFSTTARSLQPCISPSSAEMQHTICQASIHHHFCAARIQSGDRWQFAGYISPI